MSKRELAIALCRVSSLEQLQSNSLNHQKDNVLKAAESLGVTIPQDGIWQGQVSSKVGVNFDRKDLKEMYEYCKRHSDVGFLIVQEVDRFMRSPDEQTYFYVKFWYELKVRIWFADKPELNEQTHVASLLRYMEGWRAAGSNEERKNKSINGQTAALKEGRYPFSPKPGYKKGRETGIQEIDGKRGQILKSMLISIATKRVTPSRALVELNDSKFMVGRAKYKMDKFRVIVTDPFYAGILEMDKQVKVRNENGLHEPLITKDQHYELVSIMNDKLKNQSGPRKNGNPKYVLSNLVSCDECKEKRYGRLVGFDHSNGKRNGPTYEKYRCRSCRRYQHRDDLHLKIEHQFSDNPITPEGVRNLMQALDIVWKQREDQATQEATRIKHRMSSLRKTISDKVDAATDPTNVSIKQEILDSIETKKGELGDLEDHLVELSASENDDRERFLKFAFDFIDNMGSKFLDPEVVSRENRLRCKQIVFPAGFYINRENKVYTPEISELYRLATNKNAPAHNAKALLVQLNRIYLNFLNGLLMTPHLALPLCQNRTLVKRQSFTSRADPLLQYQS